VNENLKSSAVHIFIAVIECMHALNNLFFGFYLQRIPFMQNVFFAHRMFVFLVIETERTIESPKAVDPGAYQHLHGIRRALMYPHKSSFVVPDHNTFKNIFTKYIMLLKPILFLRKKLPKNLDETEKKAIQGEKIAMDILSVEDASEIGKEYLFKEGVFERIIGSNGHCDTFQAGRKIRCKKTKKDEYAHVAVDLGSVGGHYSGSVKKGKNVYYFDSMCESPYRTHFKRYLKERYGKDVKIVQEFTNNRFQPSGGFAPDRNALSDFLKNANVRVSPKKFDIVYEISHYDLLSQHHFCYIESLLYLFHKMYGTPIGPSKDPEQRLRFVKSVMWCLIFKYTRPDRTSSKFKYFVRNFPYYVKLNNVRYNQKGFYLPTGRFFTHQVKKIRMMNPGIAKIASIPFIVNWCLKHSNV
jgi:hypothetical protein